MQVLLFEPEFQSLILFFINLLTLGFIELFLVNWPYGLFYGVIHLSFFYLLMKHVSAGRSYRSNKNLDGQTVLITGAATGIGRITAIELAKLKATVIIGVRGRERAERVAEELSKESNGHVRGIHLDLIDWSSIEQFVREIDRVDILINNAGVAKQVKEWTKEGIETTFGTNHSRSSLRLSIEVSSICLFLVGHFYLTELLLPLLIRSSGRIINVSSITHWFINEQIDFSTEETFNPSLAYAQSKLANILHAVELQRRYGEQGIRAYSLHPGLILSTEIGREKTRLQAILLSFFAIFTSKTMRQGAMTTLFCALSDAAQPGKYHSDCRLAQPRSIAYSSSKARQLWQLSERILREKTTNF
jgi:retinol dehydrogenase 12